MRIQSTWIHYLMTGVADLCWDTSTSSQVPNCDGVVFETFLDLFLNLEHNTIKVFYDTLPWNGLILSSMGLNNFKLLFMDRVAKPLWGNSLHLTKMSPGAHGTHSVDLGRVKSLVHLAPTSHNTTGRKLIPKNSEIPSKQTANTISGSTGTGLVTLN